MFLIQAIVGFSNGNLDLKCYGFREAESITLSLNHLNILDVAWSSGSYRDIRDLGREDYLFLSSGDFKYLNR